MPFDNWGRHRPAIAPHGYGFSIPLRLTEQPADPENPESSPSWEGIRVEVRSLSAVDVAAGISADPDATDDDLPEALALAREEQAPTLQEQVDLLADLILGGM